jgi:hypothetical protein
MRLWTWCVLLSSGCATMPDGPVQRALYADARQIVETQERTGWRIDRYEIEDVAPSILESVCQVSEEERFKLLDWLEMRILQEGGPSEEAYDEAGGDIDEVDGEILTLERMRDAISYADERADDECPFYLKPDPEFAGVQTDTDRFVILAESFGGLSLIYQGEVLFGAGGAFRLLPGYGVSDRVTLAAGVELGGSGAVSGVGSEEGQELSARPQGAVPFITRIHDDTFVFDFEAAALAQIYAGTVTPPGVRGLFGVGIGSVRIGSLMPMALGFVAYEFYPSFRDLPPSHAVRLGTRIGVNFDP